MAGAWYVVKGGSIIFLKAFKKDYTNEFPK